MVYNPKKPEPWDATSVLTALVFLAAYLLVICIVALA
jgi:hypothetical protein